MAQRAHEQGAEDAREEEGAAKRNREAQADTMERSKGCEDKEETVKYVPRGSLGRVNSTQRRGRRRGAAGTPRAKSTAHVGRANRDTEGTARCGARVEEGRDGKAGDSNSMPCMQKDVPHA